MQVPYNPSKIIRGLLSLGQRSWKSSTVANTFSSASGDEVILEHINRKLVITLNRPKALNALNLPMIRKIYPELMDALTGKHPLELVLIKGSGNKAFCAGGDVLAVSKSYKASNLMDRTYEEFFREEYRLNHLIGCLNTPYLALIDGITMGGGCGLSLHGKFRIATERTVLAMPETALGLFPDVGGTYFLPRLAGQLGMFLALTGFRLHGSDVYHAGLATHYVESGALPRIQDELLAFTSAKCNPSDINNFLLTYQPPDIASFSLDPHLELIDYCFGADNVETIIDRLEERALKEDSDFAREQLELLSKMSPTSLRITFHQVRTGAKLSFDRVFPLEYRLTQRFLADNDFHEGCRAILIDKDRNPKWKPAKLEEVTNDVVESYFAPFDTPEKELKLEQF